ncbi:sigma-70 family RNA polymerase sigma factor [Candidatus Bipolaricaulota bacterium]|nr:sigma-70 family RNA polymerase sigma factor [Candidatus Bipolaricaulota bacterium]
MSEVKQAQTAREDADILRLYLSEVARIPPLTEQEERELARRMRDGDRAARERLILSHLRLVVSIAREYGDTDMDLLDMIQEGNMGLIEAVDRFDPELGYRLSTYARWWIRQAIGAAIERYSQMIRLPVHLFRAIIRFQRLKASFGAEGIEERAELVLAPGLTLERVRHVERTLREFISLDLPIGEGEEDTLEEIVPDESIPPPEKEALRELFREDLLEIVNRLPAREALILRRRYGLEGARPQTLAEIGKDLGITRERVRQLEQRALRRLKEEWGKEALEFYRRLLRD